MNFYEALLKEFLNEYIKNSGYRKLLCSQRFRLSIRVMKHSTVFSNHGYI